MSARGLPDGLQNSIIDGFAHTAVRYEMAGEVAILRLDGAERLNAIAHATVHGLHEAVDRTIAEKARALIITGTGRAFSSGGDLIGRPDLDDLGAPLEMLWNPLAQKLLNLPIPVITAVNGPAAGAGCSLALMSDFVVAERSAYFLMAFSRIGLSMDFGSSWLLLRGVSRQRAIEMMFLGEKISAERANEWGLLYKLTENGQALAEAEALAGRLAKGPTAAFGIMRKVIMGSIDGDLTQALAAERAGIRDAGSTQDFAEGLAAFREKRAARFTGI